MFMGLFTQHPQEPERCPMSTTSDRGSRYSNTLTIIVHLVVLYFDIVAVTVAVLLALTKNFVPCAAKLSNCEQ